MLAVTLKNKPDDLWKCQNPDKQRNQERRRLPTSCLGDADDVAVQQTNRNGLSLNGRRLLHE